MEIQTNTVDVFSCASRNACIPNTVSVLLQRRLRRGKKNVRQTKSFCARPIYRVFSGKRPHTRPSRKSVPVYTARSQDRKARRAVPQTFCRRRVLTSPTRSYAALWRFIARPPHRALCPGFRRFYFAMITSTLYLSSRFRPSLLILASVITVFTWRREPNSCRS